MRAANNAAASRETGINDKIKEPLNVVSGETKGIALSHIARMGIKYSVDVPPDNLTIKTATPHLTPGTGREFAV